MDIRYIFSIVSLSFVFLLILIDPTCYRSSAFLICTESRPQSRVSFSKEKGSTSIEPVRNSNFDRNFRKANRGNVNSYTPVSKTTLMMGKNEVDNFEPKANIKFLSKIFVPVFLSLNIFSLDLGNIDITLDKSQSLKLHHHKVANAAESKPSSREYEQQIVAGYDKLEELLAKWDKLEDHGDAVRRYLGTVGTKSPLFKLDRAFRCIREDIFAGEERYADLDALEFAEQSQAVLDGIKNSDFLAYSSIFSSYGNGGDDINLVNSSKDQVVETIRMYKDLLKYMHLQK